MKCHAIAPLALALLFLGGCEYVDENGSTCTSYQSSYAETLSESANLLTEVPESAEQFPMALVINQRALNTMFSQLTNTDVPELTDSTRVLGQTVSVSVQPTIPLLQIGGTDACPDCIRASVPFDIGGSVAGVNLPRGLGSVDVQMPIRLVPQPEGRTALVAEFQDVSILNLDMDLGRGVTDQVFNAIEPMASNLLTNYLQARFSDARIATMSPWVIGSGEVLLAGRGPFVFPEEGSVVIAMQSNLPLSELPGIAVDAMLPEGADVGVIFHPEVLGAMARRMTFERVIPQQYDESGQASGSGNMKLTMGDITGTTDGLLRTSSTLWRTGSFCGAVDVVAAMGLNVSDSGFRLNVSDVAFENGTGAGMLLSSSSWVTSGFISSLTNVLETTINYDQLFGGEAEAQTEMGAFEASVDGAGITAFFNLVN